MWVQFTSGDPEVFNFFFYSKESMNDLIHIVSKSQYETNSKQKFEDLKDEDQRWVLDALEDIPENLLHKSDTSSWYLLS